MSAVDLILPEAIARVPFSVRLAERRRGLRRVVGPRSDRRAQARRSAQDLDWLRLVRLTGGKGIGVTLVDLSEGGALLQVDAPLRPGARLKLELVGNGLEAMVPLEVLRCYVASLRGESTFYRGACAFAHPIDLPRGNLRPIPASTAEGAAGFVGTDAVLSYLLERCSSHGEARELDRA